MELENCRKSSLSSKVLALPVIAGSSASIGECLDDFTIVREVGRGASGTVYKAQSRKDNGTYALKKISLRRIQKEKKDLLREFNFLKSLRHPNVLECYGCFVDGESLYIVTEFAEHGDLRKLIKIQIERSKRIGENEVWGIIWQVALGLLHLHSHKVIHRDMKTLNILLTKNRRVKIADLGESILVDKVEAAKGKPVRNR